MRHYRTSLWIALALVIAPVAYSQPTGRLNAPDPTLTPVAQEADSVVWDLSWEPGIIRGSSPTGYETQVDVDDDPVGFEGTHLDLEGSTGADARSWRFRSLRTCGDTLWIHARVRAVGDWTVQGERVTATPWGSVTAVWAPPCEDLPPGAPEPSLDTVPPDTTEVALQSGMWLPDRDPPEFDWSPWTMEVGEQGTLCFYRTTSHPHPDSMKVTGKWPLTCPDSGVVTAGRVEAIPDSLMRVRCHGGDSIWTGYAPGDDFDLDCGGVVRWTSEGS